MKDFVKWLGVNEKIAKVAVWMLIFMVFLIVFNTGLESIGFPNYKITYDNLKQINTHIIVDYIINWIVILLNFFSIIFLIFRIKHFKKIIKYSIIYLILNIIIETIFNAGVVQAFIISFIIIFSFIYSGKKWQYLIYSIISIIVNVIIQGIAYLYKVKFITFDELSMTTQAILSIDYFIIMAVIILVKEIYIKKRGEKNGT